jgi:hypothetical protein
MQIVHIFYVYTLNSSESIWPPPFSIGVNRNEEPSPEGQRDKEIPLSQFISSLFDGVEPLATTIQYQGMGIGEVW